LQLQTTISFEMSHIWFGWYIKVRERCARPTPAKALDRKS